MKKNIFLTGGGENKHLNEFNCLFIEELNKNNIKIIYYVAFGKKRDLYLKEFQKTSGYFARLGNIKFILVDDVKKLIDIDKKNKETALFMGGGNVMRFINTIRGKEYYGIYKKKTKENQVLWSNQEQINIEKYIINFVNNGGFYYGTSSGSILVGKSLNTHMLETANEDREFGLDLLDGISIAPHYEEWQSKFYNNQEEELDTKIIRLGENDGIKLDIDNYIPNKQFKEQFIKRQMEHLRLVQDLMILLEINKDKLPFEIEKNWELLNRGMKHDLDKFREYNANKYTKIEEYYSNKRNCLDNKYIDKNTLYDCSKDHYSTQRHHAEYHEINKETYTNIDICEICCDIFANSIRNKDETRGKNYCLTELFPMFTSLKEYQKNIIIILDLLSSIYGN